MKTQDFTKALEQLKELKENKEIFLTSDEYGLNDFNLKDVGFQLVNGYEEDEILSCGYYVYLKLYIYGDKYYCLENFGGAKSRLYEISNEEYCEHLRYAFYINRALRGVSYERCGNDYSRYRDYVKEMRSKKEALEKRKTGYPYFYSSYAA